MPEHRIIRKSDGTILASAPENMVYHIEGNWYFHPDYVNKQYLETSDRVYDCPKKGRCYWIDMKSNGHYYNDCSWTYYETYANHEHINGWYGFYNEHKHYVHQEEQDQ